MTGAEVAAKDAEDSRVATLKGAEAQLSAALFSRDPTRRTPARLQRLQANVEAARAALEAHTQHMAARRSHRDP